MPRLEPNNAASAYTQVFEDHPQREGWLAAGAVTGLGLLFGSIGAGAATRGCRRR